jgi:hypothetical protein
LFPGDFMKKYANGGISEITSIQIESSASRYRNTSDNGGKQQIYLGENFLIIEQSQS